MMVAIFQQLKMNLPVWTIR